MPDPPDQEKIALSRFSVSCVSVFGTRGLLIPTERHNLIMKHCTSKTHEKYL
jgi:hypothetical protein